MKKQRGSVTRHKAKAGGAAERRDSLRRALQNQRKKQEVRSKAGGMNLKHKENHLKAIREQMDCSAELLDNVANYLQRVGTALDHDRSVDAHPRRAELIAALDELAKDGNQYSTDLETIQSQVAAFEADAERDPIIMTRDSFGICETLQLKRDTMAHRMMGASLLAQEILFDDTDGEVANGTGN